MKKMMMVGFMGLSLVGLNGCCSMYTVSKNDSIQAARQMLSIKPSSDGQGVAAMVDLAQFNTGYFSAWRNNPSGMAGATIGDLLIGAGAIYGGREIVGGSKSDSHDTIINNSVNVTGNGNNTPYGKSNRAGSDNTGKAE